MTTSSAQYRSDIDGLRAAAVAAVVLFHAGVPGFPGGYVGVDVFFVISGFLITRIIAGEMAEGRFSLLGFYERRIRRILPALLAVLAFSWVTAAVLFAPPEFKGFSQSVLAAALFVSNIFFWQTTDYFAGPAHLQPLLHTWSLAVEEQFYIVFPLLLLALGRLSPRARTAILALLFMASIGIAVWLAGERPAAAFYLLPARGWELLLGALLAVTLPNGLRQASIRELLSTTGLGLIAWSAVTLKPATAFPGVHAFAPAVGAALVIAAGSGSGMPTLAARLLGLKPVVWLGLVSYSLYLWHWPLLVFARHANGAPLAWWQALIMVALALAFAAISWRDVEQPVRARAILGTRRQILGVAALSMAGVVAVGFLGHLNGWARRFPAYKPPAIAGREAMKEGQCWLRPGQGPWDWAGVEDCRTGGREGSTVLVWGDSYAAHLVPGLAKAGGEDLSVVEYALGNCPPVPGLKLVQSRECRDFNDHALRVIKSAEPEVVVLAARWASYMPSVLDPAMMQTTIDMLAAEGIKTVLVGQGPMFDFASPYEFVFRKGVDRARIAFDPASTAALSELRGTAFFDPLAAMCADGVCPLKENGKFLYFDGGHYSLAGSAKVAEGLIAVLDGILLAGVEPEDAQGRSE